MEQKFLKCKHCGNIVAVVKENGGVVTCCNHPMEELVAGVVEASREKHIPVYHVENNIVNVVVGSVVHPMQEEHYIEWISIHTKQGNQRKCLKPGEKPEATFALVDGDEVISVYAYCNLHGLWRA